MSGVSVVMVTAPAERAPEIARAVVERGLAACVNLLPAVRSIYRWEGAVEEASETLMIVKVASEKLEELEAEVRSLHPYRVPEFLVLPVSGGARAYLDWVLGRPPA